MKLLLDTHVALWSIVLPSRIPPSILNLIAEEASEVLVSSAAVLEIAIKHRKPDHGLPFNAYESISRFEEAGFTMLSITSIHGAMVSNLPPLHADPFDRIMIAQALADDLSLVSYDRMVAQYHPSILTWR